MKKVLVISVFLFFCFSVSVLALNEGDEVLSTIIKDGCEYESTQTFDGATVEQSGFSALLEAPCKTNTNMATVVYVLPYNNLAKSYMLKLVYELNGGVAFIVFRYGKDVISDTQGESYMLGLNAKEFFREFNPNDFIQETNCLEIQVLATSGANLIVETLELSALGRPARQSEVIHSYNELPQKDLNIYHYYYRTPIYCQYGNGYVLYSNWWSRPSYSVWYNRCNYNVIPVTVCRYWYTETPLYVVRHKPLYCRTNYKEEVRHSSRRREALTHRMPERGRSVAGNSTSEQAPVLATTSSFSGKPANDSLKFQGGSESFKSVIKEKKFSRGEIDRLSQYGRQRVDAQLGSVRHSSLVTGEVTTKDSIQFSDDRRGVESKGRQDRRQQAVDAGSIAQRMKQSAVVGPTESRTITPRVEASPGKASWLEQTVGRMKQTAQRAVVVRPGGNSGGSSVKRAPSNTSSPARQRSMVEVVQNVIKHRSTASSSQSSVQKAPARTETSRRKESKSSSSSSSNSDDDEQKKRKRRVRNSR